VTADLVAGVLAAADARGSAPVLTAGGRDWAGAELAGAVRGLSDGLVADGMRAGDRVLFSVRPGADAVILALAIVRSGATVVFADPGAGPALFRARARLAAPRWVAAESLLHAISTPLLRPLARRRGIDLAPYRGIVPEARHLVVGPWLPGVPRGARRVDRGIAPGGAPDPAPDPTAEALIVFTSGTTDAPKAVVHTRGSLAAGLGAIAAEIRPGQRVLTDQLMVGIPALIAGAHWEMPPPGLDPGARPEAFLPLLGSADVLFASPAAMDALLRLIANGAVAPRLDSVILGGAPVLRPLLERVRAAFPDAAIRAVYGMTEILPVAIADGAAKLARPPAEGDWVGPLAAGVEARLEDGELVLGGAGLASYLGEPPATEVRTGDLARIDANGVSLLGRRKDMFIRGTQNVYPGLYEPVIATIPGVREAVMTGVPDAIGDDRIVVLVVPETAPRHPDPAHPVARAVARALPGLVDAGVLPDLVVAVPALPRRGRTGKLDRVAVAALARSLA
jgi:acyl-CoA synthetase (AMP-forming)/AMP-acid ligase II